MRQNRLRLAPEKIEAVILKKKRSQGDPEFRLEGHLSKPQQSAKFLGVVLESGLTGIAHVGATAQKAKKAAMQIARILPRTHGASESQRRLLSAVAESIKLYAAPVWAPYAFKYKTNSEELDRTQRTMAIRITRCYSTVSTEAMCVLARTPPWSLLAEERSLVYAESRRNSTRKTQ